MTHLVWTSAKNVLRALLHGVVGGIGVPFPQRDLHVVSVSPNAKTDLGSDTPPSPRPRTTSGSDAES